MKIALTGSSGLIGTRFTELLSDKFEISKVSIVEGVDITSKESVYTSLSSIKPDIIVHLAAKTDVDGCERDKVTDTEKAISLRVLSDSGLNAQNIKDEDWKGDTGAFATNVVGTNNLALYAKENNCRLIYISTDFVFDGNNTSDEGYSEDDKANPADWYGATKYYGEKVVEAIDGSLIVRLSFPFGFKSSVKTDFVWRLIELMREGKELTLVSDQTITPTFIDDIIFGLEFLINNNITGKIHLVGDSSLSPYEAGIIIAEVFGFDKLKIGQTTGEIYYANRAPRPFKVVLKNDKLEKLGFKTLGFEEALKIIKEKS